jgi:hypothetical protein
MAAQAPRAATGMDVWSGNASSGIATNGNQMSRNPDGTVSMTSSKYGYTETMNPDGSYHSTNAPGLFGLDQAVNGLFGGIKGPLGQSQGIQSKPSQPSVNQNTGSRVSRGIRRWRCRGRLGWRASRPHRGASRVISGGSIGARQKPARWRLWQ